MINFKHCLQIIRKDFLEMKSDKAIITSILPMSILFSLILPIVILLFGNHMEVITSINGLSAFLKNSNAFPVNENIKNGTTPLYLIFMYFFVPIFILLPVMVSNIIASYSFIGEKENRTLESLLYTPINDASLIIGKSLVAIVPSMLISWFSILIYGVLLDTLGYSVFGTIIFPNLTWIILSFVVIPLIILLSTLIVIVITQRVNSSKSAQSISMIIVLPIVGLLISQSVGAIIMGTRVLLLISLILLIFNIITFNIIIRMFNREKLVLNL
ncbi:ABC transporter permease [Streptococcus dentapri]|uniref:ABC transporter permease n=1 Tax=Streptococcus dentapri TaxID=573564 RepID=A0ABV8CZ69_9STRE